MEKNSLKNDVIDMLNLFNYYGISEEWQERIVRCGIEFKFGGNNDSKKDNKKFDCFEFAGLLRFCKDANLDVNVDKMIRQPSSDEFKNLVCLYDSSMVNHNKDVSPQPVTLNVETEYANKMLNMIDIFDLYEIPLDRQKHIINRGIYFDYFFGEPDRNNENRYFDCFRFSDFLKFCKDHNFDINVLVLLDTPYLKEFKYLVYHFCYMEFKKEREKTYQKEKK